MFENGTTVLWNVGAATEEQILGALKQYEHHPEDVEEIRHETEEILFETRVDEKSGIRNSVITIGELLRKGITFFFFMSCHAFPSE